MSSSTTQGERTSSNTTTKLSTITECTNTGCPTKKRKASTVLGPEPKLPYRELIGCLLWISMGTRPDITYAVNQCAIYSSDRKPGQ